MILALMLVSACGLNLDGGTGGASGGSGGGGATGGAGGAGTTGSGGSGDLCADTCPHNNDNLCDDGGPLSFSGTCAYGTDCTDCGVRMP
jgi:hypothetical protein